MLSKTFISLCRTFKGFSLGLFYRLLNLFGVIFMAILKLSGLLFWFFFHRTIALICLWVQFHRRQEKA